MNAKGAGIPYDLAFGAFGASCLAWCSAVEERLDGSRYGRHVDSVYSHAPAMKFIDSLLRRQITASRCTASHQVCINGLGLGFANAFGVSSAMHQAGLGSRTDWY